MRRIPLTLVLLLAGGFASSATAGPDEGTSPSEGALPDFVAELRQEAVRLRGIPWKEEIPVAVLSREQLRKNFLEMVEEEMKPEELARDTSILRRLGLLGPDEDPLQLMLFAMENMVGGYYNPKKRELFLVEGMTGTAQKPVILHELIHALEDQYVDLESRTKPYENDSDRAFAEQCLVEGSAEHARKLFQDAHPEAGRDYVAQQGGGDLMGRQMAVMAKVPAFLILPTMLHYQLGPRLVARAVGDDYAGGMTRLYGQGPVSQEQLLHPSRWLGPLQDFPQEVVWGGDFAELAGEGWTRLHDMRTGELDLALYLDFFLGFSKGKVNMLLMAQGEIVIPRAKAAARGWDGGRSYFMRRGDDGPIVWIEAVVFDTPEDATEATDALFEVQKRVNGESFKEGAVRVAADDESTREFDYSGIHGAGRLLQRGTHVLLADGVPSDILESLWKSVQATTFERDPRDTWDPRRPNHRLVDCKWTDVERGVGVHLPSDAWSIQSVGGSPGRLAQLEKGPVEVHLTVLPVAFALVRSQVEARLRKDVPNVNVDSPAEVTLAGGDGLRFEAPGFRLYAGDADGRTVMLRARGPERALAEAQAELDDLAARIVSAED